MMVFAGLSRKRQDGWRREVCIVEWKSDGNACEESDIFDLHSSVQLGTRPSGFPFLPQALDSSFRIVVAG
jgi:hypothetical protein